MPRYTACVPYHGFVDWDLDAITDYAFALHAAHQPQRRLFNAGTPTCTACGEVFPCSTSRWAAKNIPHTDQPNRR